MRWKNFANALTNQKWPNRQRPKSQPNPGQICRILFFNFPGGGKNYPIFTGMMHYAELKHANVIGSRNKMLTCFLHDLELNISTNWW